jgi:C-terminal processing protease CtpA/Prc
MPVFADTQAPLEDGFAAAQQQGHLGVVPRNRPVAAVAQSSPGQYRARRQLTTGAMASPSGMSWQGRGVVPDILMSADPHEKGELGEITTDKQLMAAIARLKRP